MNVWLSYALSFLVPAVVGAVVGAVLKFGGKKTPGEERGRDRLARVVWIGAFLWAALGAVTTVQNARTEAQIALENANARNGLPTGHSTAQGRVVMQGNGFELIAVNPDAGPIPAVLIHQLQGDAGR